MTRLPPSLLNTSGSSSAVPSPHSPHAHAQPGPAGPIGQTGPPATTSGPRQPLHSPIAPLQTPPPHLPRPQSMLPPPPTSAAYPPHNAHVHPPHGQSGGAAAAHSGYHRHHRSPRSPHPSGHHSSLDSLNARSSPTRTSPGHPAPPPPHITTTTGRSTSSHHNHHPTQHHRHHQEQRRPPHLKDHGSFYPAYTLPPPQSPLPAAHMPANATTSMILPRPGLPSMSGQIGPMPPMPGQLPSGMSAPPTSLSGPGPNLAPVSVNEPLHQSSRLGGPGPGPRPGPPPISAPHPHPPPHGPTPPPMPASTTSAPAPGPGLASPPIHRQPTPSSGQVAPTLSPPPVSSMAATPASAPEPAQTQSTSPPPAHPPLDLDMEIGSAARYNLHNKAGSPGPNGSAANAAKRDLSELRVLAAQLDAGRPHKGELSSDTRIAIVTAIAAGLSRHAVSDVFGVSMHTVRNALKRWNTARSISPRPRSGRPRKLADEEELAIVREVEKSGREAGLALGASYGISAYTVTRILREHHDHIPRKRARKRPLRGVAATAAAVEVAEASKARAAEGRASAAPADASTIHVSSSTPATHEEDLLGTSDSSLPSSSSISPNTVPAVPAPAPPQSQGVSRYSAPSTLPTALASALPPTASSPDAPYPATQSPLPPVPVSTPAHVSAATVPPPPVSSNPLDIANLRHAN